MQAIRRFPGLAQHPLVAKEAIRLLSMDRQALGTSVNLADPCFRV
jgi:hypothetical protein